MSIEQMTEVWKLKLSHSNQSLLLALADHAHDDGTKCFPGVDRLAWKTGYSRRQVIRILQDLEDKKLIEAQSEKVGGRGNATEYHLHLEKGDKKTPFRRAAKSDTVTPFSDGKGDKSSGKGDISDGKGDTAMSHQPSEPSVESSGQASESSASEDQEKPKSKRDRSKPAAPDYRAKVESFLEEYPDVADEVREYIARGSSRNESGEMTYSRQWRAFCLPVYLALRDGTSKDAVLYALQEANNAAARNISYFETVLEHNPDGRVRKRTTEGPKRAESTTPPIAGDEGAARRSDGYEWLFEAGERTEDGKPDAHAPETGSEEDPDEAEYYLRRLKIIEQHMKRWRATLPDQGYQKQVFLLKNRAAENGVTLEEVERLDEQIRAEHTERAG